MTINEITEDILKKENNLLTRAFTMVIGSLLVSKGIQPIMYKSERCLNEKDDLYKHIIKTEYNITFDIDTTKHDMQIRANAIEECINAIAYCISASECDEVLTQLKEQNK